MSKESDARVYQRLEMLELQLEDILKRESAMLRGMKEAEYAIIAIKELGKEECEVMVPFGMGAFAKARISADDKFVLNIGGGASIEKDADSTLNHLESIIKGIEIALRDILTAKSQVEAQINQIRLQVYNAASHDGKK